ncbi:retropepsin-like aspartic protease [Polaribacter porphyrae]|uniref:retropepsin-like aspartic protease n=1 Tax=Polaribacter porphyrae TaxID=1137780 RepID=UPI001CFF8ADC|nr:retropepsin-like aspartic protease [Polaribacter porphyrae]
MKKNIFLVIFFAIAFTPLKAQNGYHILNNKSKKERVKFKLINNLIVIPLVINEKKLSFILDSGVSKTILFNISQNDSIGLNNVKTVKLQGLGNGEAVDALLSKNNKVNIKSIENYNETIYVILKDYFDLSGKMGTTIHGIIGYNILKNFVVKINYKYKYIDFYKAKNFKYSKCKKCEVFPIQFYRKKPYIKTKVQLDTISNKLTDVTLLVDSGGSDAIWLFEHTKKEIITPNLFFRDILGEGLSGSIYGNRSRIPMLKLKSFEVKQPTVSFLDSISTRNARNFKTRNGSIGGGILKRFIVWFDYPNKRMTLKKQSSLTKRFNYNMSGLVIVYNGKQLVREEEKKSFTDGYNNKVQDNNTVSFISRFSYKFKPSFKVKSVLKNSPAEKAGILKDDIILKLNGVPSYDYTLGKIIQKFQEKSGRKIRITVERNGVKMKFQFRLEKRI